MCRRIGLANLEDDETNFMMSEHDTNNFKIGLVNLEDDEEVTREQDQRAIGEQLIQE